MHIQFSIPVCFPVRVRQTLALAGLLSACALSSVAEPGMPVTRFADLPATIKDQVAVGTPRKSWEIEDSPFGIHTTVMAEGADDALMVKLADLITDAGFKWTTDYLTIGKVKDMTPAQVGAKFTPLPARCLTYAQLLHRAKVKLLIRLDPLPWEPWKNETTGPIDPDSEAMQKAEAFVRTTVRQLKPYVRDWQIWNEPNIGNRKPLVTPKDYVAIVKKLAAVIREEQQDAVIYGPGTAMLQCLADSPYPWIPEALKAGLASQIDVFSFHPYRAPRWKFNLPENASQFYPWKTWADYSAQIMDLRRVIRENHGGKDLRLAATEDGLSTFINGAGEEAISLVVAAKYELRRALMDFHEGIYPRTQFCLYRKTDDMFYTKEAAYNIVTSDFQKKPQYIASQNLNAVLDSSFKRDDTTPVSVVVTGPARERFANEENPGESFLLDRKGERTPAKVIRHVYRRETADLEELMVFYWSAEPSEDTHVRYTGRIDVNEPGWSGPLLIDLMAMPARRPKNEIVVLVSSNFVNRSDPVQLDARTTAKGVAIDNLEVRDYPMVIKWIRPKSKSQ
ncbi:MAG: hypothetical protein WC205_08730 [Opitutaceae bacterium]|jgi:hypothetical protein